MNDEIQRLVFERALAFFGCMTAGVSHELKNALSIVNELGGLMEDLLLEAEKGRDISHPQLARIAEGIARQVQRSDDHIKRLHHFSHNADDFQASAPLDVVVDEIVVLCRRLADLKRVRLAVEHRGDGAFSVSPVFLWQHAVYECICLALAEAGDGDSVTVSLSNTGTAPRVRIAGSQPVAREAIERKMPLLLALMEQLGCSLDIDNDSGVTFTLAPAVAGPS